MNTQSFDERLADLRREIASTLSKLQEAQAETEKLEADAQALYARYGMLGYNSGAGFSVAAGGTASVVDTHLKAVRGRPKKDAASPPVAAHVHGRGCKMEWADDGRPGVMDSFGGPNGIYVKWSNSDGENSWVRLDEVKWRCGTPAEEKTS